MEFQPASLSLISVGILFGIVQIAFLLYFFLSKKSGTAYKAFGIFLIVILWAQIEAFLNRSGYMGHFPHLLNTSPPFIFLLGPLLYLHSRAKMGKALQGWKSWIHFLPFALYFGYSFFFFLQPATFKYNAFVRSFQPGLEQLPVIPAFEMDPLNIQGLVVVELLCLHMIAYSVYTLFWLYRQQVKKHDSWLIFVNSISVLGGLVLFLSQGGVINGSRFLGNPLPVFMADLFPTLATYAVSFYILKNGFNFKVSAPKYYKSPISKELKNSKAQRVIEAIEKDHLYLRADFSLQLLAESCGMSTHHLSQVLNEEMGLSFFELTNKYRITEAKRILSTADQAPKMEQLAYELGYKSKSTFFTAFKKFTDMTPSKYHQSAA